MQHKQVCRKLYIMLIIVIMMTVGCTPEQMEVENTPSLIRIATVNNPDMIIMQELSKFYTQETGVEVEFVFFSENDLRKHVIEDLAIGASQFDIVTIGTYDVPFWAQNEWIVPLDTYFSNLNPQESDTYDLNDFFDYVGPALSFDSALYALPFYGETSILYYRTDIFQKENRVMPENPTWQDIYDLSVALNHPEQEEYGIILRGKKGWGMNLTIFNTIANAFGARWYDMDWNAQFDSPEMQEALSFYKNILSDGGQPRPDEFGYLESLELMKNGHAAMWYDASVAAGTLESSNSSVAGKIGYRMAPVYRKDRTGWLWAWVLAIESSSIHKDQAFDFLLWATSKDYTTLVGREKGWQYAPSGTRKSTYENPAYQAVMPAFELISEAIQSVDYDTPTVDPAPYKGIQYLSISRFVELGELVSQNISDYLAGDISLDEALIRSQDSCNTIAREEGYK